MHFLEAQTKVAGGRNRQSRKLENHTYVERIDDDTFGIRLHATHVVLIHRDGTFTLQTGGWRTMTTKARINSYAPVRVGSDRGRWFLYGRQWEKLAPFVEGLRVDSAGSPLNAPSVDAEQAAEKSHRDTLAAIKRYVEQYLAAAKQQLYVDALDQEPEGAISCWDCTHPTMAGRTTEDGDAKAHLRRHLAGPEFPPALMHNALSAKGAGSYYFALIGGTDFMVDLTRADDWQLKQYRRWLYDFVKSQLVDGKPFRDWTAERRGF